MARYKRGAYEVGVVDGCDDDGNYGTYEQRQYLICILQ